MDLKMFDNFQKECSKNLAGSVDGIEAFGVKNDLP